LAALTILDGSTFCICDELGDIAEETSGFFSRDTRFLSRFVLKLNGARPLLLSSGRVEHFAAAFFLRNAPAGGLPRDAVSIARNRFVGTGMRDTVVLENETSQPLAVELALELAADFADIITVKQRDFALGDPLNAPELPEPAAPWHYEDGTQMVLGERDGEARTQVVLSRPGLIDGGTVAYQLELGAHERWELQVDVVTSLEAEEEDPDALKRRLGSEQVTLEDSVAAWTLRVPKVRGGWDALRHSFEQSIGDLAALRIRSGGSRIFAAGMPWFMTVFGRDTLITSLETLLLGPELAVGALDELSALQADEDDPTIDAEPGKIVHELREGAAARTWFGRYYGTVDATPLFLVLLSEVWRWTDDSVLAQRLREPALRALAWIDRYGDQDGDGFVEYRRRTERGLLNQSWKDSGDSQRFSDGRLADPPIAPVEVQGYVYDAKVRLAELAREVWRDRALADRLESEAAELKARFDEAFWVDAKSGYYALALDADKRQVDARCSNLGHLLWSGIVPDERVDAVTDQLLSDELWSGWGIRTMARDEVAFSPLSYHNGTVWPHDTALAAWGLARNGHVLEARQIVRALLEAAGHFDWSLPEVFAGYARSDTPFPIAYPTAARPQAWAAGAPILLLQVLLGIEPERVSHRLVTTTHDELPSWVGDVRLEGVRAYGRIWTAAVEGDRVSVTEGV
jgi:glycogen debranching enzyme